MKRRLFCHKAGMAKYFGIGYAPVLLFLLISVTPGCKEKELHLFLSVELFVNGQEIAIPDSVFYIITEDSLKTIKINPDPSDEMPLCIIPLTITAMK